MSIQRDILSTFGGFFRNEQLMRLSEQHIPFQLFFDNCYGRRFSVGISPYESFKLRRRSVLSLSTTKFKADENEFMLETSDGKFLSVTEVEKHKSNDKFITSIEFTVCDTSHSSPIPSCLFSLLPQPDGRVVIQSLSPQFSVKFIKAYMPIPYDKLNIRSMDDLSCATKFLLAPEPENQIEWCAEFGGSVGLQQLNRLQTLRLPFYLLAKQKTHSSYVNAQETHYFSQCDECMYPNIEFQEEPNTFILHDGCADGTNCLLYASCGRYLCVVEHPGLGPFLGTSELKFDINDATPLPKFLFDFVPCFVKYTFSIRSHYNQKYLRFTEENEQKQEIDKRYSRSYNEHDTKEIDDSFPVDANEKTATEFTLSPIGMSYAHTT